MELLIIKSGKKYIRVKDNNYLVVQLDKASVFPMNQIARVSQHKVDLNAAGFKNVRIKKLILTEKDL